MKKIGKWRVIWVALLLACFLSGCGNDAVKESQTEPEATKAAVKADIVIRENMFVTMIDDVFTNADNYMGKNIQITGYVYRYPDDDPDNCLFAVLRDYFCCGTDTYPYGIDCLYDGDKPAAEEWVTVTGALETYFSESTQNTYYILNVKQIAVLPEDQWGERVVYQ